MPEARPHQLASSGQQFCWPIPGFTVSPAKVPGQREPWLTSLQIFAGFHMHLLATVSGLFLLVNWCLPRSGPINRHHQTENPATLTRSVRAGG